MYKHNPTPGTGYSYLRIRWNLTGYTEASEPTNLQSLTNIPEANVFLGDAVNLQNRV